MGRLPKIYKLFCLDLSALIRCGLMDADRPKISVQFDGLNAAVVQLTEERDAVRVVSVDPYGNDDEPPRDDLVRLVWQASNLGINGYWYFKTVTGRRARKLYRARNGWGSFRDLNQRPLYKSQTRSHAERNGRSSGSITWARRMNAMDKLWEDSHEPYRKEFYNGRRTPYGKRLAREFNRLYG